MKKENTAPNHDGKAAPFGSGYKKAKNLSKILKNLNEKLSKSQIKKMRDKFNKTGKLPPHLMKLAKLMDKHTEVRNIVVPGLEWMSKLGEGKLKEGGVEKVLAMADGGYGKLGGKIVDGMSANLFKAVYNKANDKTKEKINKMNEKQLYVFMSKLWSKFGKQVSL